MVQINKIIQTLVTQISEGNWHINDTQFGKSKTSYIAELGNRKVFIKPEPVDDALLRLAQMEIAPKILYGDEQIIIQEFVAGEQPTASWIADNYHLVAAIIKRYHADAMLRNILKKRNNASYDEVVRASIADLKEWEQQIPAFSKNKLAQEHLADLILHRPTAVVDELVPVHADPNSTNYIVQEEKIYLVDWDDITLSDPMRDIGQFAWNYIPKEKWDAFIASCGLEPTKERKRRFFWWIAIMQLFVGFWFYIYQKDVDSYNIYVKDSLKVRAELT